MVNKFYKVVLYVVAVGVGSVLLSFLPECNIAGVEIKKVDFFSDILADKADSTKLFAFAPIAPKLPVLDDDDEEEEQFVDSCKTGVVCIEDFSENRTALTHFYEALTENKKPIRIAYFGDSFIEGDLFTASLRDFFKEKYGGEGVGFVPINCITAGFRQTVVTYARDWDEYSVTDSTFVRGNQGISGHYFFPDSAATATFSCRKDFGRNVDTCSTASIYFKTDGNLKFTTTVNRKERVQHSFTKNNSVQKLTLTGRLGHVRITVDNPGDNSVFYGVALDNEEAGVVVDNFAQRGTSGLHLMGIPQKTLHDFDKIRHYDLIVLQYGLNVATPKGSSYANYKKSMLRVINYLKTNFPQSDILLVSVGDRAAKESGKMVTMPGVLQLAAVQRAIAYESGVAFWNMIEGMEIDGGIVAYVDSKPRMANLDYTHVNRRGGEQISKRLFEAFEYGKERYFVKKEFDDEHRKKLVEKNKNRDEEQEFDKKI